MASIAHVVKRQTIEFHRLHSHRKIIFWRFNTKNFSNFAHNDLLFFLSKTNRKEKGLIGFGQLKENKNLKTRNVFKKYGLELGYQNETQFYEAINQAKKTQEIPDKLNCLLLENVTYFKTPIYLSEFGYKLNKQVESFIYLDQEKNLTSQILMKAKKDGLDLWSETQDPFNHQLTALATLYDLALDIQESQLFKPHDRRFKLTEGEPLMMMPSIHYELIDNKVHLTFPVYTQDKKEHYALLGLISQLKKHETVTFHVKGRYDLSQSVLNQYISDR